MKMKIAINKKEQTELKMEGKKMKTETKNEKRESY